jgi:MFS family permease
LLETVLRLRTFDALHYRDYRLLWLGQACVSMGIWMDQVARSWLLYQLTDSPLQLGLIRGLQAIPLLLLSPVAGTAADRYDRKLQLMAAQVVDGSMYALLAALIFTGHIAPWHVYLTAFLGGVVQVFESPARLAMVSDTVPAQHLTNAIALSSVLFNLSRSTGPALAGLAIAAFGTGGSYAAQAGLYFVATVWTFILPAALRFPTGEGQHHARRLSFARSTLEGWKFSWSNDTVRAGLLITMLASLFIIPFTTQLPVFARDILGVGATGQGLLLTGMGIGAFCSAVLVASLGDQLPRGIFMLIGVTLYGISVVAFASSPWFPLSVALMVVVGSFHVSSHALVQTVIQTYSLPEFRGRTMGVFQQSHVVMMVGSMLLGALASVWGAPHAVAVMGVAGALAMIGISVAMPHARRIR